MPKETQIQPRPSYELATYGQLTACGPEAKEKFITLTMLNRLVLGLVTMTTNTEQFRRRLLQSSKSGSLVAQCTLREARQIWLRPIKECPRECVVSPVWLS